MTAIESALAQFRSDPVYGTIPVPERSQMEELITHLFNRATRDMSIHIFRRPARGEEERDFTVISFTEHPVAIRKVVATTKYWSTKNTDNERNLEYEMSTRKVVTTKHWSIKNTDNKRVLEYEMSTKTIVLNWVDPLRAKVISVDYDKHQADVTDFFWEEEAKEASVQSETKVTLYSTRYCFPQGMTWDKIISDLEEARLIETRMRDSEISGYPVDIVKISELKGEFSISVRNLETSRQHQFIRQHLLYLYNKLLG